LGINRTEIPVASDDPKCLRDIQNPSLNSVEEWLAIDVLVCGSTKRTTECNQIFQKIQENNNCLRGTFQSTIPRNILNKELSKKFLPKNSYVVSVRTSFPVEGDNVHTERNLFLKP